MINRQSLVVLVLLSLAVLAVYLGSLNSTFVLDDHHAIIGSQLVKEPLNISKHFLAQPSRFLFYWTLSLNAAFAQLNPAWYRIFNIFFHIANSFLLFLLLKNLPRSENNWKQAFCVALIFALHPLNSQPVIYIVQRLALMTAFFYLAALVIYFKYRQDDLKKSAFYIGFISCAGLAMFTKEHAFSLPFVVVLAEFLFFRQSRRDAFFWITLACLACLTPAVMYLFHSGVVTDVQMLGQQGQSIWLKSYFYFLTQLKVSVFYLKLVFFPAGQSLEHDITLTQSIVQDYSWLILLGWLGLLYLAWHLRQNNPLFSFGIGFYLLAHGVESSIVPIPDLMYEHRMYLPMAALGVVLYSGLVYLRRSKNVQQKHVLAILFVVALAAGLVTTLRAQVWQTEVSIWSDVLAKYPQIARAQQNLAVAYVNEQHDYRAALPHFEKAAELNSSSGKNFFNLAVAYENNGRIEEAIEAFKKSSLLSPLVYQPHMALLKIYYSQNKFEAALREIQEARPLVPKELQSQLEEWESEIKAKSQTNF